MHKHTIPGWPHPGQIRQLRPSDLANFREHLLRLDTESRRDRFNGVTDDIFVGSYAARCFSDGTTVIGYVEDGEVHGAAELHERPDLDEPTGEIAFSVERHLHHKGIGSALFSRLIAHAQSLGYEKLRVTTHPQNEAMKALARKFKARLIFEDGETVGTIEVPEGSFAFLPAAENARLEANGA
ncbi:MAG: GNAT family N-acetyltransferase [Mesorhizobium sp.]|nr:GNAT family N-acetyltransferase [Mesorhizobium sp.]